MSRGLPPQANFQQLRHQAKDLLRAQQRKDFGACGPLRRLHRFSDSANDEILNAPLALHEAQYALALDYGFTSWNAMKRYVEKVSGRPSSVRRETNRTYITGLERHPIGGDGEHENSIIACIAGVMAALGEENLSYEYLMGVSGAAFRVQLHQPNWCASAACAPCGYDCVPEAMKATGYRITWIDTQREGKPLPEGIQQAFDAVTSSIERGLPVILAGKEAGLIVGHHADGRRMVRPYCCDVDGYKDTEGLEAGAVLPSDLVRAITAGNWAWGVGVIEPHDLPMPRDQAVRNSFSRAITLATTERFGDYFSGFAALQRWSDQLVDETYFTTLPKERWFPTVHANGYCYGCLWASRKSGEKYLRLIAKDYDESISQKISEIADIYGKVCQILGCKRPEYACAWSLMPWRMKGPEDWTPQMRRVQAQCLREILAFEEQAISKMEKLMPLLQVPPHNGGRD